MSRVGKLPIPILDGVKVEIANKVVKVEGPKGKLSWNCHPTIDVSVEDKSVVVKRSTDEREDRALHGLTRSVLENMVLGVKNGYEKKLELFGVGYTCQIKKDILVLRVGLANEIHKKIPQGLAVACPDNTHIVINGCDKQLVGQFTAEVRAARKPEAYKGKGVRYQGEVIKLKPGKTATK